MKKMNLILAFLLVLNWGCAKVAEEEVAGGGASDISVSGTLALSSGTLALMASQANSNGTESFASIAALDIYKVYCVTFEVPPAAGSGTVATGGDFAVTIANASNVPFGCFIQDTSNSNAIVGTLVIEDDSQKGMDGESSSQDQLAVSGNATLGAITLDLNSGKAVVKKAAITVADSGTIFDNADIDSSTAWDFSGSYTISDIDFTPSSALGVTYTKVCAADGSENETCRGPQNGEGLYLERLVGSKFTKDVNCTSATVCPDTAGTIDNDSKQYGIQIWRSATAAKACGDATNGSLGFTAPQARFRTAINFVASEIDPIILQNFQYAGTFLADTNDDGTGDTTFNFTNGWKIAEATSSREIKDCKSVAVGSGYRGYQCTDSGAKTETSLDYGGCTKDSDGSKVQMFGWVGNPTCLQEGDSGGPVAPSEFPAGYKLSACSGTAQLDQEATPTEGAVTCLHASTQTPGFDWNNVNTFLVQGGNCVDATDDLAKLRCYAEFYFNYERQFRKSDTACLPQVRLNWQAGSATEFEQTGHGSKDPMGLHVFSGFHYSSASAGTFKQEFHDVREVQLGVNSYIHCQTSELMKFSITKKSDVKLLTEMTFESHITDQKPICHEKWVEESLGHGQVMRSLFYMNKN